MNTDRKFDFRQSVQEEPLIRVALFYGERTWGLPLSTKCTSMKAKYGAISQLGASSPCRCASGIIRSSPGSCRCPRRSAPATRRLDLANRSSGWSRRRPPRGPIHPPYKITDPKHKLAKTYWVQADDQLTEAAIEQLRKHVKLKDEITRPAKAENIEEPELWPRNPPVRFRKHIPASCVSISITDGQNRRWISN